MLLYVNFTGFSSFYILSYFSYFAYIACIHLRDVCIQGEVCEVAKCDVGDFA